MKDLSVKNVNLIEEMSEETPCFTADVYRDGKLFAHARNSGHGGCNDYTPAKGYTHKDVAYLMNIDEDCHIMQLVEEYNYVTKNQSKALVLREVNPKEPSFPKLAIAKLLNGSMALQKKSPTYKIWLERQRKSLLAQGYEIINRNL